MDGAAEDHAPMAEMPLSAPSPSFELPPEGRVEEDATKVSARAAVMAIA